MEFTPVLQQPRRIAGYARVSTPEQALDSQALEQQIARLKEAGATEIFQDILSGSRDDRPQFQRLINLVLKKEVDEVVFTRIDRLTRSVAQLSSCIEIFEKSGVNLKILDQQFDLSTPAGKLMVRLLGAVAEWETDLLAERVRYGKQHRIRQRQANESCPWGYITVDKQYQLDQRPVTPPSEENKTAFSEEEWLQILKNYEGKTIADIARVCAEIFLQERSLEAAVRLISRKYGTIKQPGIKKRKRAEITIPCWTSSGLRQWLTNPVLCGHTQYNVWATQGKNQKQKRSPQNSILEKHTHPDQQLLSEEESEEIRRILAVNLSVGGSNFNRDPASPDTYRPYAYLSGLVYCYKCGARCDSKSSRSKSAKKYYYFVCPNARKGCDNEGSVKKTEIEQHLIGHLISKSRQMHEEASQSKSASFQGAALQILQWVEQTKEVQEQQKSLSGIRFEHYLASQGRQPEGSERLDDLQRQYNFLKDYPAFDPDIECKKQSLLEEIAEEKRAVQFLLKEDVESIIFSGNNLLFWEALTDDAKVSLYPQIVYKIFVYKGKVKQINFKTDDERGG